VTNPTMAYPGTAQHQALLQAVLARYKDDSRVLAVIVFGSLGRGNWDAFSDIDLDVVIADGATLDVLCELERLCEAFTALNERVALIIPDGDDAGDVVLESLMQLSIRYHPLAQTSPNIVESMQVLVGSLDHAAIAAAGNANRHGGLTPLSQLLDQWVRYAAVANVCLQRKQIWSTVEVLHRMRNILMEIFAHTHGGQRAYQVFESDADERLQARLGATLPQYDLISLRESLETALDIVEDDLDYLANGQLCLTEAQRAVLYRVRQAIDSIQ
jgi:predicted nucleotidyltransferase